jgi:phosphatidylinositol glycan class B
MYVLFYVEGLYQLITLDMSSTTVSRKVLDEDRNQRNRSVVLRDIIVIRLINAWWIATFFQPDEFFQSLEPAWNLAFGSQSGAWLTWVCYFLCLY